jgi:hypothetical protein
MTPTTPPQLQARRSIEDRAVQLGTERAAIAQRNAENTWAIIELLRDPQHALVPLDHLASMLGVSRQSLYRWREIGQKIPADLTVAQAMTMTDEDGAAVYYFG